MTDDPIPDPRGDILVVDDTPANLKLLAQMLTEHGYQVRAAHRARRTQHIFERFYRGRVAADYKTPGTGAGRAISQEILTRLNGRLTVESEVGRGSTFTVWLPVVPAEARGND